MKRFWDVLSEKEKMIVFDRSWYGRILVERIEGFASEDRWKDAYDEINRTEKYLYDNDFLIIKYFLSIDKDTQLSRFKDRENDLIRGIRLLMRIGEIEKNGTSML